MCKGFTFYLYWHRLATMPLLNERQKGEAIGFLLRGEDQISVPERFHVSQSTLSRLRRRVVTTGSLNDHLRSGRPRVATWRKDQETPLLHLRNRFQAVVKTTVQVQKWSRKAALIAHRPYKGLSLTCNRKDARMDGLRKHRRNRFPLLRLSTISASVDIACMSKM
jgi:transposase